MATMEELYMTRQQAADLLGIDPNTITWLASPKNPRRKLDLAPKQVWPSGKCLMVTRASVNRYAVTRRQNKRWHGDSAAQPAIA